MMIAFIGGNPRFDKWVQDCSDEEQPTYGDGNEDRKSERIATQDDLPSWRYESLRPVQERDKPESAAPGRSITWVSGAIGPDRIDRHSGGDEEQDARHHEHQTESLDCGGGERFPDHVVLGPPWQRELSGLVTECLKSDDKTE